MLLLASEVEFKFQQSMIIRMNNARLFCNVALKTVQKHNEVIEYTLQIGDTSHGFITYYKDHVLMLHDGAISHNGKVIISKLDDSVAVSIFTNRLLSIYGNNIWWL